MRWGISSRVVSGRGRDIFFRIYSPEEADAVSFLLLTHKWPRPCHWGCLGSLASFLPRMFTARARVGLDREGPGHGGPALSPHPPSPLPCGFGSPARAPAGSAFVFPTPVTFAEVLPAPGAQGCGLRPPSAQQR